MWLQRVNKLNADKFHVQIQCAKNIIFEQLLAISLHLFCSMCLKKSYIEIDDKKKKVKSKPKLKALGRSAHLYFLSV